MLGYDMTRLSNRLSHKTTLVARMKSKKQLDEMTLDELYAEKRLSDNTFPSIKNVQNTLVSFSFFSLAMALGLYAMKDNFSYILAGILLGMTYYFVKKLLYTQQLRQAIKSRC